MTSTFGCKQRQEIYEKHKINWNLLHLHFVFNMHRTYWILYNIFFLDLSIKKLMTIEWSIAGNGNIDTLTRLKIPWLDIIIPVDGKSSIIDAQMHRSNDFRHHQGHLHGLEEG